MPEPEAPRDLTQPAPAIPGTESLPALNDQTSGGPPPGAPPETPARIGRYEIRAILGNGAFGRVYRGFDTELHREVAIKVPLQADLSAEFRERFLREARAAAAIHHPNVCSIYDVGTDGELPYIVMQFVQGGTLSGMISRRKELFDPRQAAIVVRKLAMGLSVAHAKGVIHRDLKPQNVLVDDTHGQVLITDFGLARLGSEALLSRTGEILGTPVYMSPEQARGKQAEVGPLSDVYSLGVILYQLMCGELPFQGSALEVLAQAQFTEPRPPIEVRPGLDPRLNDVCLKAMARKPENRFSSARALADALEAFLRGTASDTSGERPVITVPPPPTPDQPAPLELDDEPAMFALMRRVAHAALNRRKGGELASEVADALRRDAQQDPGGLRIELQALAAASPEETRSAAAEIARESTASKPDERVPLEMYLTLLPTTIRRALRRADDVTGLTLPGDFRPDAARLAGLLPPRLPRFREEQTVPNRPDWVLLRWLGGGCFGEAWLATFKPQANRRWAVVKFGTDLSPEQRIVLTREARPAVRAAGRLHPGVVRPFDAELAGNPPWVMYEHIGGGDLTDLIFTWAQLPPAGRVRAAVERLRELTDAVAGLHALNPPLVHRGLRPANVLRDPGDFRLCVTDIGTGGVADSPGGRGGGSRPVAPLGADALLYASPQQQRGEPPSPRDDVYALGVIAFQMLTGALTSGVPTDYNPILRKLGVPPGLIQLIGECAATEPEHRPPDARALADRLTRLANPADPAAVSPSGAIRFTGDDEVGVVEVLVCPGCRARMQVKVGRAAPVQCPRCARQFPVEAGRTAPPIPLPVGPKPGKGTKTTQELTDEPAEEPRPRPRSRAFRVGCWLAVVAGVLAFVGIGYQDQLQRWADSVQAKPIDFVEEHKFEPGADEARVYGFLPGDSPLLLTNSDNKDVVAGVWNVTTGKRLYVLKNCPPGSNARLEPQGLRFRMGGNPPQLAAFHRDVLANDRGGVWLYDLPKLDAKESAPKSDAPELTPHMQSQRERAWDVSRDLEWAVGPPGNAKVKLWKLSGSGSAVELDVPGTTFRAVAFSPNSKWLVALDDESRLWFWSLEKGIVEKKTEKMVRLAVRPDWAGANTADLLFDPEFTRVTVATELRVGVWDVTDGRVLDPMKRLVDGQVLRDGYRLRVQTAGKGSFSVFHDEYTLRAKRYPLLDDAVLSSCLSDDRSLLAASSRRTVTVWRLKYPLR